MSYKAGFVGLIGQPNAGKSSLMNALIGEKVGIVTSKPQTTRQCVTGVYNSEEGQILFLDAPGKVNAKFGLNLFLKQEFEKVVEDADALVGILNIDEESPQKLQEIMGILTSTKKPKVAIITKVDKNKPHRVKILEDQLKEQGIPCVTASTKRPVKELREDILPLMLDVLPESSQPLMDTELYTTQNSRDLSSEIIREKCFDILSMELPYNLAVEVLKFKEDEGKTLKIFAELVLSRENHKQMVVGRGGKTIKEIGTRSRLELEKVFGRPIYLNLFVKVRKNWVKNEAQLSQLGYQIVNGEAK